MIKDVLNTAESKMKKTISVLTSDLTTLKAGRANPKMLDRIQVEAYGGLCPIEQVGNISAPEPRMLVITPWDKSLLKDIEKAILKSDLGINPSNDGSIIRLLVPELTEERRKDLVKEIKKMAEEAKIAVRSVRRDGIEEAKAEQKEGNITEDELKQAEEQIQKLTDKSVEEIDKILEDIEKAKYVIKEVRKTTGNQIFLLPVRNKGGIFMAKRIITINRMFGSNGRLIGKTLAENLDIGFYDKELIDMAAKKNNIPFDTLAKVDEKKASQWVFPVDSELQFTDNFSFVPMNDVLYDLQRKIILSLPQREDCVIVGRCATNILKDKSLKLFIHAPFEERVQNVIRRTGREEASARKLVKKMDKERKAYYEYFTDSKWLDMTQYDLCIDSSRFSMEQIIEIVKRCL